MCWERSVVFLKEKKNTFFNLYCDYYLEYKYIYHSMRYLFGIYKALIKCGLQRNSDKIALYRSIYGISSELDTTRIYMNTVK